jgi:hypothetical protein
MELALQNVHLGTFIKTNSVIHVTIIAQNVLLVLRIVQNVIIMGHYLLFIIISVIKSAQPGHLLKSLNAMIAILPAIHANIMLNTVLIALFMANILN